MWNLLVGIIILIALLAVAYGLARPRKKEATPEPCTMGMLSGEVVEIRLDEETGLTRITAKDGGRLSYGFSSLAPEELEPLYMGKGWVQLPVIRQKQG